MPMCSVSGDWDAMGHCFLRGQAVIATDLKTDFKDDIKAVCSAPIAPPYLQGIHHLQAGDPAAVAEIL